MFGITKETHEKTEENAAHRKTQKSEKDLNAAREKERKAAKKLIKVRRKAEKKVLKYRKKTEKIRRRADEKAKKYTLMAEQIINASKPQVGDPVIPDVSPANRVCETAGERRPLSQKEEVKAQRKAQREREEFEKAEKKRIARGDLTMYERFVSMSFEEVEAQLMKAERREERAFYRTILNLKLQLEQEKVIGEVLV